jgi:hypothetical protein
MMTCLTVSAVATLFLHAPHVLTLLPALSVPQMHSQSNYLQVMSAVSIIFAGLATELIRITAASALSITATCAHFKIA